MPVLSGLTARARRPGEGLGDVEPLVGHRAIGAHNRVRAVPSLRDPIFSVTSGVREAWQSAPGRVSWLSGS